MSKKIAGPKFLANSREATWLETDKVRSARLQGKLSFNSLFSRSSRFFFSLLIIGLLIGMTVSSSLAMAATTNPYPSQSQASSRYGTSYSSRSSVSSTYQTRPSFQTYYGQSYTTYWPILGNEEQCEARQDLLLQVAPAGCQPMVVRSDLLAEQDVPVFCQIDAVKLNPLIDINQIRSMSFAGQYPAEISGVGYHPARAALRTYDRLLGSPLVNNVGYVVVILKRQPDESKLPDMVNVTLQARVDYVTENAYGIGRSEFVLEPTTDSEWESEKLKQSFWNGRYFVRLEHVEENYADISIYNGDQKVVTTRVQRGETSRNIFMPGMYCRAGLSVSYDDFVSADKKARIEISNGDAVESFDVYEGSRFMDNRCTVSRINMNADGFTGSVRGSCRGEQFELKLQPDNSTAPEAVSSVFGSSARVNTRSLGNGAYSFDVVSGTGGATQRFRIDNETTLHGYVNNQGSEVLLVRADGSVTNSVPESQAQYYRNVRSALVEYRGALEIASRPSAGSAPSNEYYSEAIENYEAVGEDYAFEMDGLYGKEALTRGISLARTFGDSATRARLAELYISNYPGDIATVQYLNDESIYDIDVSSSAQAIEFDDATRVIRLVSLDEPRNKASADIYVERERFTFEKGERQQLTYGGVNAGTLVVDDVQPEDVRVSAYCTTNRNGQEVVGSRRQYVLREGVASELICGLTLTLDRTNVEQMAKVRLTPSAFGTETDTNITVAVGIEKRAIELTPEKAAEKVENLNKTIAKWENINEKLGRVVSGMKAACFATAAALTFKNLAAGLSGETIARQEVMKGDNGWHNQCKDLVASKKYPTLDACYIGEADKINADVARTTNAINSVNAKIKQIQSKHVTSNEVIGQSVDTEAVRLELANEIRNAYAGTSVSMGDKTWRYSNGSETKNVPVGELLKDENIKNGLVTTDDLRSIYLNLELQKGGAGGTYGENVQSKLTNAAAGINQNVLVNEEFQKAKAMESNGYPPAINVGSSAQSQKYANVIPITDKIRAETGITDTTVTHIAMVNAAPSAATYGQEGATFGGSYVVGLSGDVQSGVYNVRNVVRQGTTTALSAEDTAKFAQTYGIGAVRSADRLGYVNEIVASDRQVKYFETEPYRGMPAIVPFSYREGWYAATRQDLPSGLGAAITGGSGIGAYDASGRVTSFWLCNVGDNGRVEFNTGYGDDLCQQVNTNTGQPLNVFPGLDQAKASSLVNQAVNAISQAARQYGGSYVTIGRERYEVGAPEVGVPGTRCQDFMAPEDCHILFNVCDPVVCPSSRCNLGGTYYVANVAQTGIIGSLFMCLPNVREGIVVPVCLTGVHAGIDGFISIMKNYRDCLAENVESGEMVGICDQIYSVYLCEFFWNQVAPFVNVLIPKMIEFAYGQGTRGGVEYLSVMSAWQNMENSVNYFTQSYAVNSMTAFQARNIQEAGGQFCQAAISVSAPTAFKSLIEPDSPPQFHAWFDSKTFTTATVPATSSYKVFYHIFAGKDQGVYYSVYLRDPPSSGYYAANPTVQVATGYAPAGEYRSETKDFTAPQGYQELCVRINNDEKCGFKQVSTSFAVKYVRDSYVSDQIKNTNIQSESACIGGSADPRALITPNIQQGVEEVISPEIYNRGVVRICGTQNPGIGTDPTRFVEVGYCDDPKVKCWLDQRSVENAITPAAVGLKNETLSYLENLTLTQLQNSGLIFGSDEADAEIRTLLKDLDALKNMNSDAKRSAAAELLRRADFVLGKVYLNTHKARILLIKGEVNEIMALEFKRAEDSVKRAALPAVSDDIVSGGAGGTSGGAKEGDTFYFAALHDLNNPAQRTAILDSSGAATNYYVLGDDLFRYSDDFVSTDIEIGTIRADGSVSFDNNIVLDDDRIPDAERQRLYVARFLQPPSPGQAEDTPGACIGCPGGISTIFIFAESHDVTNFDQKTFLLREDGSASDYYALGGAVWKVSFNGDVRVAYILENMLLELTTDAMGGALTQFERDELASSVLIQPDEVGWVDIDEEDYAFSECDTCYAVMLDDEELSLRYNEVEEYWEWMLRLESDLEWKPVPETVAEVDINGDIPPISSEDLERLLNDLLDENEAGGTEEIKRFSEEKSAPLYSSERVIQYPKLTPVGYRYNSQGGWEWTPDVGVASGKRWMSVSGEVVIGSGELEGDSPHELNRKIIRDLRGKDESAGVAYLDSVNASISGAGSTRPSSGGATTPGASTSTGAGLDAAIAKALGLSGKYGAKTENIDFVDSLKDSYLNEEYNTIVGAGGLGEEEKSMAYVLDVLVAKKKIDWTIPLAYEEALKRDQSSVYTENKKFIDAIAEKGFISPSEYDDIAGWAIVHWGEEDMAFVTSLLAKKVMADQPGTELASSTYHLRVIENRNLFTVERPGVTGDNTIGALLANNIIYSSYDRSAQLGTVVQSRIVVNAERMNAALDEQKISWATYCHLKFLDGKMLSDVEAGTIVFDTNVVFPVVESNGDKLCERMN